MDGSENAMLVYILFIIGFIFLVKGADFLVDGAAAIARQLHISDLAIGLTVVAFGTSLPELFVNVVASLKGNSAIAIGNVVGSNIANILLILGISALIFPLAVTRGTVWKEIPFSLLAALVLFITANDALLDGSGAPVLTRSDGLVYMGFFCIFIYYTASIATDINGLDDRRPTGQPVLIKSIAFILLGLTGLVVGGKWIVDGAVALAAGFGMSESLIGLTIVAVGTSLPELATSVSAAFKRNADIAVGNVVGSNIFNVFFVLGISAAIKPLPFQPKNNLDVGLVVVASLLLFLFMFTGRRRSLDRWEGAIFVLLYASYTGYLIWAE